MDKQITSLVKTTILVLLFAFFLYLNFRRKHFNHRNFTIYAKNPNCLSEWGQSCWTKYLCQWNSTVLWAFCGKLNTTEKRMLICAFFRCKCTQALIYHTVQMTTVSNHLIAGLSHDLLRETSDTNCHRSHLATAWVRPPAEADCEVKPINFGCHLGAYVGLSQQKSAKQKAPQHRCCAPGVKAHVLFSGFSFQGHPSILQGHTEALLCQVSNSVSRLLIKNMEEASILGSASNSGADWFSRGSS